MSVIYAAPAASFETTLAGADTSLTGTIGVQIVDGQGNSTVARTTSNIVESPASSGVYTATLTAPSTAGQFTIVWDTGGVSSSTTAVDELVVTHSSLAPVSPTGTDLTTLAAVRQFLQKQTPETGQDTQLQTLISAASTLINTHIAYFPAENAAEKTFVWRGGSLPLHPYFLRTATSVVLDTTDTIETTLAATDYRLRPKPARLGAYRWLSFPGYDADLTFRRSLLEREVTITGDWGFSAVPADVQHWTNVTVAIWLRRDVAAFSTTLRLEEDRLERPDKLPSAVTAGLARYADPRGM